MFIIDFVVVFQSYLIGTHSSLKSGTLDLDLSTTAGMLTGRDENIQIMPDISDSEVRGMSFDVMCQGLVLDCCFFAVQLHKHFNSFGPGRYGCNLNSLAPRSFNEILDKWFSS